jgi:DNA polymerase III epsilon subunit-like protein
MRILFFDTETTGLPKDRNLNALLSRGNWPDLVSISWMLFDCCSSSSGPTLVRKETHIIKPQGWNIPAEAAGIHGITDEIAHERGVPLREVLLKFKQDMEGCAHIIAHNMEFDRNVLQAAYKWRLNADPNVFWPTEAEVCTMVLSQGELKLPAKWPKPGNLYKPPRLDELWVATFGEPAPVDAHSADRDVDVLQKIFWARWGAKAGKRPA